MNTVAETKKLSALVCGVLIVFVKLLRVIKAHFATIRFLFSLFPILFCVCVLYLELNCGMTIYVGSIDQADGNISLSHMNVLDVLRCCYGSVRFISCYPG